MNGKEKIIRKIKKQVKGITLVSLVVTIIILLILAGVTLSLTIGNNGIIKKAFEAVEQTEIAGEKEIVQISAFESQMKNEKMILEEEEFQIAMDNNTSEGETEVADVGDEFEVIFWEKNRYYTVDKDGQIIGEGEIIEDENPGDITTGKDGEELDGSEEHPYEIWCIEDLIAFSNMVNGEGYILKNGEIEEVKLANSFDEKYIALKRTLSFKSKLSYANSERTDFGDINGNVEDGNVLINEMQTGTGFKPIGRSNNIFSGNFNGENNEINNIYIDCSNIKENVNVALFGTVSKTRIKNLTISGKISGNWNTGGIVGEMLVESEIINCKNKTKIKGYNHVGGIVGKGNVGKGNVNITQCENYGIIEMNGGSWADLGVGGIVRIWRWKNFR